MGINNIIMTGNLTRDVEVKVLPSGTSVAEFCLACNEIYYDKDGNKKEDVCFIDCRCYGKRGETIAKYLSKGSPIGLSGKLKLDTWKAQDGSKRSKHILNVLGFDFLGGSERKEGRVDSGDERSTEASPPPSDNDTIPF